MCSIVSSTRLVRVSSHPPLRSKLRGSREKKPLDEFNVDVALGRGCNSGCGSLLDLLAGAHPKADFGDPDKGHRRDRFSAAIELPMIAVVVLVSQNMQDVHSALPKLFRRTSIASRPRRSAELGAGIWLSTLKQPRRFPAKISTGDRIGRSGSRAPRHSRVIRTRFGCGTVRQKRVGRSLTWKETPAP